MNSQTPVAAACALISTYLRYVRLARFVRDRVVNGEVLQDFLEVLLAGVLLVHHRVFQLHGDETRRQRVAANLCTSMVVCVQCYFQSM